MNQNRPNQNFTAFYGYGDPYEIGKRRRKLRPELDESSQIKTIRERWNINSATAKDRLPATFIKEQDLEAIELKPNPKFVWSYEWWNGPPFIIPENELNAEEINAILIKSWEVQASSCPSLSKHGMGRNSSTDDFLIAHLQIKIVGCLKYYFDCIPSITQKIKRVIGLKRTDKLIKHDSDNHLVLSYLKIGKPKNVHEIENQFAYTCPNPMAYRFLQTNNTVLYDEDPGTTNKFIGYDHGDCLVEDVGEKKLKLVLGKDDKMEQKLAFESCCTFYAPMIIYDIAMRKFIKEKFGVEIQSLAKKWSRLCWNCLADKKELKTCSICHIAQYCSKDCQRTDWIVHKELHKMEKYIKPYDLMEIYP